MHYAIQNRGLTYHHQIIITMDNPIKDFAMSIFEFLMAVCGTIGFGVTMFVLCGN